MSESESTGADDVTPANLADEAGAGADTPPAPAEKKPAAKKGPAARGRKPSAPDDESEDDDFDHPLKNDPALKDVKSAADEIQRLRAELAAAKGSYPPLEKGGRFTGSIKDGPTVTFDAQPGESPQDAFLRTCGIHSTPHKIELHEVPDNHPIGVHLPNGQIKSLSGPEMYQPIGAPAMKV